MTERLEYRAIPHGTARWFGRAPRLLGGWVGWEAPRIRRVDPAEDAESERLHGRELHRLDDGSFVRTDEEGRVIMAAPKGTLLACEGWPVPPDLIEEIRTDLERHGYEVR